MSFRLPFQLRCSPLWKVKYPHVPQSAVQTRDKALAKLKLQIQSLTLKHAVVVCQPPQTNAAPPGKPPPPPSLACLGVGAV
jgi:hypothetical protein